MLKKLSRPVIIAVALALLALSLIYAFWPKPVEVDFGRVERRAMIVTIDEEARTRVHNTYTVTAPVTGQLLRPELDPGDPVSSGETIVAQMLPAALDARTEKQALAIRDGATAALTAARAAERQAQLDLQHARDEFERTQTLYEQSIVAQAVFDRAELAKDVAARALEQARAMVTVRRSELENARATLESYSTSEGGAPATLRLTAPATGQVLNIHQESEAFVVAGTPLLTIGDPANDLEIVTELLSTDAVRVEPGDRVIIDRWGGPEILKGSVHRIEPAGFTKFSALGVEEQRVRVIVRFDVGDQAQHASRLGDGFRVETRIVIWELEDALTVPSSALFREGGKWALFAIENGTARLREVSVGENNGITAQVLSGVTDGEPIVLYPGSGLEDGIRVSKRDNGA